MQFLSLMKLNRIIAVATTAFLLCNSASIQAHTTRQTFACEDKMGHAHDQLDRYLRDYPWIGLVMDKVTYGPVTVSHVNLNEEGRLTVVDAGSTVKGQLTYHIDEKNQDLLDRHHLIVGIKEVGAQDCVTHTYGILNSSDGVGSFELKAPLERGIYQIRITYQEAKTCEAARSVWNESAGEPSSNATIGILIVK